MITRDDWMKALEEASAPPPQDPDALTTKELADLLGYQLPNAARLAKRLLDAGRVTQTTKMIQMCNGGWRRVPAYKLVKDEQASV